MNVDNIEDKLKIINRKQEKYGNRGLLFLYAGASCVIGTMAGLTLNQSHLVDATLFTTYISITISAYNGIRKKLLDLQEDNILKKIDNATENKNMNIIAKKIEHFNKKIKPAI